MLQLPASGGFGDDNTQIFYDNRENSVMVRSNTIVGDRSHPRGMVVSRIVRGNIPVQNGVVHLIDKPLMIVARTLYEYILVRLHGLEDSYYYGATPP